MDGSTPSRKGLRIAIIGAGAAGITAAHVLQRDHDVTLFEASASLGGHAHAAAVDDGSGGAIDVDTAFLIYNHRHYPSFVALLEDLGVAARTQPAEMSAAFIDDDKNLHFALQRGLGGLLYQRRNLLRPGFYRLFVELALFRRRAYADVSLRRLSPQLTLGQYLSGYSVLFRDNFVVPLASAIWSLPGKDILAYPAFAILQFFENHGLLEGESGDAWRTFDGSSSVYLRAFTERFTGRVRTSCPVLSVVRDGGFVDIVTAAGAQRFDKVILATHADVSLRLLAAPSREEEELLGAWRYHANTVILHGDARVLHPDRRLWASWNVVTRRADTRVTYCLNRVQKLRSTRDYFLTLGETEIDPRHEVARFAYRHPIFDCSSVATQPRLPALDGLRNAFFCGSYMGHGFHEDAVASALHVCSRFGLALTSPCSPDQGSHGSP